MFAISMSRTAAAIVLSSEERATIDMWASRGTFKSVSDLVVAVKGYMENHNQNPRVFVWTAPAEKILTKIAKCKEALAALH